MGKQAHGLCQHRTRLKIFLTKLWSVKTQTTEIEDTDYG